MKQRFHISRCCCGDTPPSSLGRPLIAALLRSNQQPPYFVEYIDNLGFPVYSHPRYGIQVEDFGDGDNNWFGSQSFGLSQVKRDGSSIIENWTRDNLLMQFTGGVTVGGTTYPDLPEDPASVVMRLWLRNWQGPFQGNDQYEFGVRAFWYPNQGNNGQPLFGNSNIPTESFPRMPLAQTAHPWSPTAITASDTDGLDTDGLPTEAIGTFNGGAFIDYSTGSNPPFSTWYTVDINVTDAYRSQTQWWRDTARPDEQLVNFVLHMEQKEPTAAQLVNLTDTMLGAVYEVVVLVGVNNQSDADAGTGGRYPQLIFS